jgi:hypothetical protein
MKIVRIAVLNLLVLAQSFFAAQTKPNAAQVPFDFPCFLQTLLYIANHPDRLIDKKNVFDLCQIVVPGTELFCQQSIPGATRDKMPQLSGVPAAGTPAYAYLVGTKRDPRVNVDTKTREVDIKGLFEDYLNNEYLTQLKKSNPQKYGHYTALVSEVTEVPAVDLKATQTQLVGDKVAGMWKVLTDGPSKNPIAYKNILDPILVTKDNFILDGHHRAFARIAQAFSENGTIDRKVTTKVKTVDLPIKDLLDVANKFAQDYGIAPKSGGVGK